MVSICIRSYLNTTPLIPLRHPDYPLQSINLLYPSLSPSVTTHRKFSIQQCTTFLVRSAAGNLIFLLSCASIANYYGGSTHNGEFSCNSFITHQPAIWWRDTSKPRVTDTVKLISPKVAEGRDGTSIGLDQHCASIWSRSSYAGTEEDGFYITLDHLLTPELMLAKQILVHMHYLIRTKSCSSSLLDLIASEKS